MLTIILFIKACLFFPFSFSSAGASLLIHIQELMTYYMPPASFPGNRKGDITAQQISLNLIISTVILFHNCASGSLYFQAA